MYYVLACAQRRSKKRIFILSPFTKKGVCVRYPLYQRVVTSFNQFSQQREINHAGGPRAIGWLGPTKTHPMCRVNVPAKKVDMGTFGCSL